MMVSEAYDLLAGRYRRGVWDIIFTVNRYCNAYGAVADFGCGPGHNSLALIKRECFGLAFLLDLSFRMVERAVECFRDAGLLGLAVCGDMVFPPLRDGCVDAVLMVASLHHLTRREDRLRALRESFRVLKAGGAILVVVWGRWQVRLLPLLLRGVARYVLRRSESPWDVVRCSRGGVVCREYHLYSLGELVADVRGAGFKVVEAGTYVAPGRKSLPRKNYYVVGLKAS